MRASGQHEVQQGQDGQNVEVIDIDMPGAI